MRCALIDSLTRQVVNVIMADPTRDRAPDGFEIASIPDGLAVEPGWLHSADRGFVAPKVQTVKVSTADDELLAKIAANPDGFLDNFERGGA